MLPRAQRLAHSKDVLLAVRRGKRFDFPHLTIKVFYQREAKSSRATVIVSTKVSKLAVKRNLLKRIAREAIKAAFQKLPKGDWALIVKPSASKLDRKTWREEIELCLKKAITRPSSQISYAPKTARPRNQNNQSYRPSR